MAQRRLTLRKIKEILRLKWGLGLSARQVGASLRISHSTVGEYLKRAEQAGMDKIGSKKDYYFMHALLLYDWFHQFHYDNTHSSFEKNYLMINLHLVKSFIRSIYLIN